MYFVIGYKTLALQLKYDILNIVNLMRSYKVDKYITNSAVNGNGSRRTRGQDKYLVKV